MTCLLRDREGEYEEFEGAEDVKYAGSSGSESSELYWGEVSMCARSFASLPTYVGVR